MDIAKITKLLQCNSFNKQIYPSHTSYNNLNNNSQVTLRLVLVVGVTFPLSNQEHLPALTIPTQIKGEKPDNLGLYQSWILIIGIG